MTATPAVAMAAMETASQMLGQPGWERGESGGLGRRTYSARGHRRSCWARHLWGLLELADETEGGSAATTTGA
jgi:hypothetical protein